VRILDSALDAGSAAGLLELARSASTRQPSPAAVQVVILAAGMGTRLGRPHPKPLTQLHDGRSIMQRQLDTLREVFGDGVDVTIVVGFKAKRIMRAAADVRFTYNPDYAKTNTSKSLLRALRATRDGGVLWLNGDVVFDREVLEAALPHLRNDESFVCVDTSTVADEEVKYTLDADGCIAALSKRVTGGLGEAVGINYVSAADKQVLVEHLEACGAQDYFERGIETAILTAGLRFQPVDISRFSAVEIDFETDLERANKLFSARARLRAVETA
jgi:choline kinase